MLQRVSVALRCGGLEIPGAILCSNLQRVLNADGTHAQRFDAQTKILWRTGRRSEIEDIIYAPRVECRADISLLETEAGITSKVGKVPEIARRQVVYTEDRAALAKQAVSEMRTKESGSAGYKSELWQISILQN
jgi:hypothetical protein